MRTSRKTKRELAVSAALIDSYAAQIQCEADHECLTEQEAAELHAIGRRLQEIAESLFEQAEPGAGRIVFDLAVDDRLNPVSV